jgi:hypothetical protein
MVPYLNKHNQKNREWNLRDKTLRQYMLVIITQSLEQIHSYSELEVGLGQQQNQSYSELEVGLGQQLFGLHCWISSNTSIVLQ